MPRMKMARLYFKTSISSLLNNARQQQHQMQSNENIVACFTIDYIVKGNDKFQLIISQQSTETGRLHVLNRQQIDFTDKNNKRRNRAYVNLDTTKTDDNDDTTFIIEILCQSNCTNGSTFSILRMNLNWTVKCST